MTHMTALAWIMMLGTWGVVAGCTGYCFYRLMTSQRTLGDDD